MLFVCFFPLSNNLETQCIHKTEYIKAIKVSILLMF